MMAQHEIGRHQIIRQSRDRVYGNGSTEHLDQLKGYMIMSILIDQSPRYGHPQAACREPAGSYDKTTRTAICFEHSS